MVKDLTDADFEAATADGLDVIDFWAPWCGPCKMQGPVIEQLAEENPNINFFKLNVDDNQATSDKFGIRSIPTLMIKKDGEVVDQIVGLHSKDQLEKILTDYAN